MEIIPVDYKLSPKSCFPFEHYLYLPPRSFRCRYTTLFLSHATAAFFARLTCLIHVQRSKTSSSNCNSFPDPRGRRQEDSKPTETSGSAASRKSWGGVREAPVGARALDASRAPPDDRFHLLVLDPVDPGNPEPLP